MNIQNALADRVTHLKASAIREIFKLLGKPGIISFAGGIPSPELFPTKEWGDLMKEILDTEGSKALVYGVTEGYAPLVKIVEESNAKMNVGKEFDRTIITTGAQQGIDLLLKSIINEGDGVICEDPSFIGTLNSIRSYRAELHGVAMDECGIRTDLVEEILKEKKIKLIYTIPTFQNPTGITQTVERRKKLLELAEKYDCYILEDNPYGDLRFKGEVVPTIKSMDTNGRVIYVGSFSKTLSPGIRVGFITGHEAIIDRVIVCKQVNDVHTPLINQMLVEKYIQRYDFDAHIKKGCDLYGHKCALMLECMDKYFPENVSYTRPEGGIFLWCTVPEGIDTQPIFKECIDNGVAFVPGSTCMVDIEAPSNCFRLNYSTMPDDKIEQGIKIIGEVLAKYVK
ncbi:MAG: PLP-dependent aminotransferase family protein [Clostridia bacterium]|nr:PLP-dependent aminotransferase family protein [Clostridia bacterium]